MRVNEHVTNSEYYHLHRYMQILLFCFNNVSDQASIEVLSQHTQSSATRDRHSVLKRIVFRLVYYWLVLLSYTIKAWWRR